MSVLTITNKNYEEEVSKSKVPVLLDFWAPWCGPCKMLSPIIDEIAEEQQGKIKVGKINIDDEQQLALKFNVMSIPTLVVMHEGKVINTSVGVVSKQQIIDMLERIQRLEKQKQSLFGIMLIIMGIAMIALSQSFSGTNFQDFISGLILGLSVGEMLTGVYIIGRTIKNH